MIRAFVLLLCLLANPAPAATVADQAASAAADLKLAVDALNAATGSRDRVAALSRTIRAYEQGLAALRSALRQADLREASLTQRFEAKRDRISRILGVMAGIDANPGTLLLLHPDGPLGTARSGMMLAAITPALQAEAEALKAELNELVQLRALHEAASATLSAGLTAAQTARTALSQAVSDRTDLPKRFTEDPEVLLGLLQSADTLDAFAAGLALNVSDRQDQSFIAAMGTLPFPVLGTVIRKPDEADGAGVRRPGVTLSTPARALVTAPWPSTIRYLGPLLDYGNVMIIEPGDGYLLVLAGLETVYGEVGEVVGQGEALGLMGGMDAGSDEFTAQSANGTGGRETETLYMELRQGAAPVNPMDWFTAVARTGD